MMRCKALVVTMIKIASKTAKELRKRCTEGKSNFVQDKPAPTRQILFSVNFIFDTIYSLLFQ